MVSSWQTSADRCPQKPCSKNNPTGIPIKDETIPSAGRVNVEMKRIERTGMIDDMDTLVHVDLIEEAAQLAVGISIVQVVRQVNF